MKIRDKIKEEVVKILQTRGLDASWWIVFSRHDLKTVPFKNQQYGCLNEPQIMTIQVDMPMLTGEIS